MFKIIVVLGVFWGTPNGDVTERKFVDVKPLTTYATVLECRRALRADMKHTGFAAGQVKKLVEDSIVDDNPRVTLRHYRAVVRCAKATETP